MSKSHYFVQRPPEEQFESDHIRECEVCGRLYEYHAKNQRWCCPECKKIGRKRYKAEWFQRNKKRLMKKQTRLRRESGMLPREEYFRRRNAREKRNRIVKSGLVQLELLTFQVKNDAKNRPLNMQTSRIKSYPERAELVKKGLRELELYPEQIIASDKYHVDFSQEFKGSMVKMDNVTPPELPLKK